MGEELQFDRAEYAPLAENAETETGEGPLTCACCKAELPDTYFEIRKQDWCPPCTNVLRIAMGTTSQRFFGAFGLGFAAAVLGIVVYYAVLRITGFDLALITILIGVGVAIGVRKGSRGYGGTGYQVLAIGLTYFAIVATYTILLLQAVGAKGIPITPLAVMIAIPIAIISPFLDLPAGIISLFIIGFGLYEAWKLSRIPKLTIEGPFEIDAA